MKLLVKQEQAKFKISICKEKIKIRVEMNEMEAKNMQQSQ
jgi:hypothetical protein